MCYFLRLLRSLAGFPTLSFLVGEPGLAPTALLMAWKVFCSVRRYNGDSFHPRHRLLLRLDKFQKHFRRICTWLRWSRVFNDSLYQLPGIVLGHTKVYEVYLSGTWYGMVWYAGSKHQYPIVSDSIILSGRYVALWTITDDTINVLLILL